MYTNLLIPCLLLLALLPPPAPATAPSCPGCTKETAVNKDIVDFALQELVGAENGLCKKSVIRVENFTSQVVAGTLYKFNLVLEHSPDNPNNCGVPSSSPENCHMEVYDIPWENKKSIRWDQVDCVGKRIETSSMGHLHSANQAISIAQANEAFLYLVLTYIFAKFSAFVHKRPNSL